MTSCWHCPGPAAPMGSAGETRLKPARVIHGSMMSTHSKPASTTPKFNCCYKGKQTSHRLNRPQGSPKADLEDVLLFQLTLIAAPSIQLLHVSFAVITSKALKNILYLSEHRSKKTKTKPHLRGFPTYKTEYDSDFYSQSTFLLSKVLKVIISSLNSALFAF